MLSFLCNYEKHTLRYASDSLSTYLEMHSQSHRHRALYEFVLCNSYLPMNLHCRPNQRPTTKSLLHSGVCVCAYVLFAFMLSVHHVFDLLAAYFPYLLMSLKMQIKTSQVLDGKELSRWDSRQPRGCKSDCAAVPSGSVPLNTAHNTHLELVNSPW